MTESRNPRYSKRKEPIGSDAGDRGPTRKPMRNHAPNTITKRDLVKRIAERTGQTKVLIREIIQEFLDEIADELERGNRLEVRKFGVFEVRARSSRVAQNPRTMIRLRIPEKRVVKFKVGNVLKRRVEKARPRAQGR
ncbi:MAG: HU family DNA-binding protein [Planctomycetota bacterium]